VNDVLVYTVVQALSAWVSRGDRDKMEITMDLLIIFTEATFSLDSINQISDPPSLSPL